MTTDKTIKSKYQPKQTNVTWVDLSGLTPVEKHFINGRWVEIGGGSGSEGGISNVKIAYPIRTLMINDGTAFFGLVYKKADFETANLLLTVVYGESKPMYIEYITILPRTDNNISIVNELSNNGLTQYKDMSTDEGVPDWVKKYFLLYPDISENSGENTNLSVVSTLDYDLQEDEIALYISRSYPG